MKKLLAILAATTALATPALAGSLATPMAEPMVPAPAPMMAPVSGDWTGGYGGVQLGYGSVNATGGLDGDGVIGGLIAGYDYDFGQFVLGAGVDYDVTDIDIGGATTLESVARLKLRAGYDLGQGLIYATAGGARAETSTLGRDNGWFAGAGYEQKITDSLSLGGEVLYHQFDDFNGTGVDVDATTVQVRAMFRF